MENIFKLEISSLSGNKVSLKIKQDSNTISSIKFGNVFCKQFENLLKSNKSNLSININDDKMQIWSFSKNKNFQLNIDDSIELELTKEDIEKIINSISIKKRDILESKILTFDEFVSDKYDDSFDGFSDELEDELLFDINDEPINLDKYDSKSDFNYVDCYSDEDFETNIDNCFGYDFYDEIEEMASFTEHGLERIKERGISSNLINNILDSCRLKLLKFKDEIGKKILIRSTKENVSVVGTLQKINNELKFKVITAIQGIGLKYDEDYNLIKI